MIKHIYITIIAIFFAVGLHAEDYKASMFDIKSDGVTSNTESIQYAIDFISENGGGQLNFYVGRYLTGSIHLKPNVTIQLHEGAILVAKESVYEYFDINNNKALILADSAENIGIIGKGVIEGRGIGVLADINNQAEKGFLKGAEAQAKPSLIYFNECSNIKLDGIIMRDACGDVQVYSNCDNVDISNITIHSNTVADSRGVVVQNSKGVNLTNSYIDTSGKEVNRDRASNNVSIKDTINPKGKKL